MYATIADVFRQTVLKHPKQEAIVDVRKNVRWTYAQWDAHVNRLANALTEAGIRKGDTVSTFLYNGVEFSSVYFACAKIGAVINPINFRLKEREIHYILSDADTRLLVYEQALKEEVEKASAAIPHLIRWMVDPQEADAAVGYYDRVGRASTAPPEADLTEEDICSVMYSSGTTGRPKGVLHRHREIVEQSMAMIAYMHYAEGEKGLIVNPMFHCGELHSGFFSRVHVGGGNVIMHRFDARKALRLMQDERIASMVAVPTIWKMLLQEDLSQYDLSHFRVGMYGGESMEPAVIRECLDRFGIDLVQAYGMTEMGPTVALLTFSRGNPPLYKAGAAGKAVLNHEIRVVRLNDDGPTKPDETLPPGEVGEIIVRGSCVMAGYRNNETATREAMHDGWYRTGDLGYKDEDGDLWVVDRKSNMIVSGGENIYPKEIEYTLAEHPAVRETAVVGAPDAKWGETVVAFVVAKSPVTEAELNEHCKRHLANYKRPRKYFFVAELPRNGAGKVLHRQLKEMAKSNLIAQEESQ
jgi:fatty-acyl-CoA synthase